MTPLNDGATWSEFADWYDDLLVAGSGPHETAAATLEALVPEVTDERVLDIACGQGIASRLLASLGARVTGTDFSEAMIANARRHGTPVGHPITYVVDDAQRLAEFDDATFAGVTCQLGLMDIPDLDATLVSIARVLRAGGWFAFVIGHPCVLVPEAGRVGDHHGRPAAVINGYFDERFWRSRNPQGVRRAGNHHRTLSTYLNALGAAGFHLEVALEPEAGRLLAEQQPLYAEVPIFFAGRARSRAGRR